jgi:hypothetical protein
MDSVVLAHVVENENIWMRQRRHGLGFTFEAR